MAYKHYIMSLIAVAFVLIAVIVFTQQIIAKGEVSNLFDYFSKN